MKNTTLHHTATTRGYIGVGQHKIETYNGRFGKGYKVLQNNPESTRYCLVQYWVY